MEQSKNVFARSSLLPLALLVVVVGGEALDGPNAVVDHPLHLGLEVLLVRHRVRNLAVNCGATRISGKALALVNTLRQGYYALS